MLKKSTLVRAFVAVAVVTTALSGCAVQQAAAPEKTRAAGDLTGLKVAYAMNTSAADVYVNQRDQFVKQAKKLGASVTVYDNAGDASATLSNADLMVASKPDVIVDFSPVADANARVGQKFKAAGIPCIAGNIPIPGCALLNFDQPYLGKLGAKAIAAQMAKRGWTAKDTTVVIGQASALGESVNVAVTSFYAALTGDVPGMTAVKQSDITPTTTTISGEEGLQADLGVTLDGAYAALTTALQSIPKGRHIVVYTVSDDATKGAIRALKNGGRADADTMVSGFGGGPDFLKAVRSNTNWVTDQMGWFSSWGEFALAMVAAIDMGEKLPALTAPPMLVLTADNVDKFYDGDTLKVMPELPEGSKYLLKTGILQKFGNVEGATE